MKVEEGSPWLICTPFPTFHFAISNYYLKKQIDENPIVFVLLSVIPLVIFFLLIVHTTIFRILHNLNIIAIVHSEFQNKDQPVKFFNLFMFHRFGIVMLYTNSNRELVNYSQNSKLTFVLSHFD